MLKCRVPGNAMVSTHGWHPTPANGGGWPGRTGWCSAAWIATGANGGMDVNQDRVGARHNRGRDANAVR